MQLRAFACDLFLISRKAAKAQGVHGKPVVGGTRITVQSILGFLSAGDTVEDVLEGYPQLSRADVLACLDYARRLGEAKSIQRLAS